MLRRLFFGRPWLGLDIQPHTIHFVECNPRTGNIGRKGSITSVEALLTENKITNWALLISLLSNLTKTYQLTHYQVVTSLPVDQVQMQSIQVPVGLTHTDILNEIDRQTAVDFPWLSGVVVKDYALSLHANKVDWIIHFVVAHKDAIDSLERGIERAGLKLKIVDVDIFAICRVAEYCISKQYGAIDFLLVFQTQNNVHLIAVKNKIILHRKHWQDADGNWVDQIEKYVEWNLNLFRDSGLEKVCICALNARIAEQSLEIFGRFGFKPLFPIFSFENTYLLAYGLAMHGGRFA